MAKPASILVIRSSLSAGVSRSGKYSTPLYLRPFDLAMRKVVLAGRLGPRPAPPCIRVRVVLTLEDGTVVRPARGCGSPRGLPWLPKRERGLDVLRDWIDQFAHVSDEGPESDLIWMIRPIPALQSRRELQPNRGDRPGMPKVGGESTNGNRCTHAKSWDSSRLRTAERERRKGVFSPSQIFPNTAFLAISQADRRPLNSASRAVSD